MPEGDSLHRAAARLQVLVGQRVEVETPHPRAAVKGLAAQLDGKRLEAVAAEGKNLLLSFEDGLVLRSHLRMNGRWRVERRGAKRAGKPWLVLRGAEHEAVLWNGPVLELVTSCHLPSTIPDIVREVPEAARFRGGDPSRQIGDALLDQRLAAGIGNIWKAEALWEARVSPWRTLDGVSDDDLAAVLEAAHRLMAASVEGTRPLRRVYRRAGRACPRCGAVIRSAPQGDNARTAYWCPGCQVGGNAPAS
jgi:endonuclease VIII